MPRRSRLRSDETNTGLLPCISFRRTTASGVAELGSAATGGTGGKLQKKERYDDSNNLLRSQRRTEKLHMPACASGRRDDHHVADAGRDGCLVHTKLTTPATHAKQLLRRTPKRSQTQGNMLHRAQRSDRNVQRRNAMTRRSFGRSVAGCRLQRGNTSHTSIA